MPAYKNATTLDGTVTLANYLALLAQIEAMFLGGGWVQATDSGQSKSGLNAGVTQGTTIVALPGNFTSNFQIWRMADTAQGTTPVFLKLYFGNTSTTFMGFDYEIGTGSNGSGAITGQKKAVTQVRPGATPGAGSFKCKFTSDTHRAAFFLFTNGSSAGCSYFSIERNHNDDGSDSSLGVSLNWGAQSGNHFAHGVPFSGVTAAQSTNCPNKGAQGETTLVDGADVYLIPTFPAFFKMSNPNKNLGLYYKADITEDSVVTPTVYGQATNYITIGGVYSSITPITNASFALIWI